MNYFNPKTSIITIVLMLVIGLSLGAQPFPIRVLGNGDNVYVNSTDVDNEGNIYITGSVAPYVQVRFDPCGLPITYGDGASGTRIFTAKLNPSGSNVLWMVTSSTQPYGNIFAGNDIEVDSSGNAYVVGTISGTAVNFTNVGTGDFISACGSGQRHFVSKISSSGTPLWISETKSELPSYGEGLTLDEDYGRLHTGGYVGQAGSGSLVQFPNADCTGGCGFNVSTPVGYPSSNVGFITSYNLSDGSNTGGYQIGERVMALAMDRNEDNNIWITGSRHEVDMPDRDVLFAKLQLNMTMCGPLVIDYSLLISDGGMPGGDIGLDITCSWDNNVIFVGNFSRVCNFPSGPTLTTGLLATDHFVASWDPGLLSFTSVRTTSSYGPVTANNNDYMTRTICVASPQESSAKVAIAYDKDVFTDGASPINGRIISRLLYLDLMDINMTQFPVTLPPGTYSYLGPYARAMEIVFNTTTDDKFLVGDHYANVTIGGCYLSGGISQRYGYVSRINDANTFFYKKDPLSETSELKVTAPSNIEIYPNPSGGLVQLSGLVKGAEIQLIDLTGKEVLNEKAGSEVHTLDLSDLQSGIYLIQVYQDGEINTFKLTLE
ncbi:MAG TPA: hypothetical protein DCG19_12170 [Cryomorphaceae bacterium]|nr:hypothetical protein [Owenweeksia sp.]HAD98156.1 hypothetical protein [Cryomorphaceae bacterium]HBF19573.1 hypothetical protein [Cryomorphaceae bacterium]HCQ15853.1 hypothetical protein [Cryomorphaceae bacterium]|tara:strand:+ start:6704 stop:8512 length:1809 start_codon:yes stop_codon:yes gene_type:complete